MDVKHHVNFTYLLNDNNLLLCVVIGVILDTVMLHGPKELNTQKPVQ